MSRPVPDRDLMQALAGYSDIGFTGKPSPFLTGSMRARNPAMGGPEGLVRFGKKVMFFEPRHAAYNIPVRPSQSIVVWT